MPVIRYYINRNKDRKVKIVFNGDSANDKKSSPWTLERVDDPLINKEFRTQKEAELYIIRKGYVFNRLEKV